MIRLAILYTVPHECMHSPGDDTVAVSLWDEDDRWTTPTRRGCRRQHA